MKVIQEVVSPEVSKIYHAVMTKKQGDKIQMQFSVEKEENEFIQPIIPVHGSCIKWRNRFINFIRIFFICLKMLIMQQKKQLR